MIKQIKFDLDLIEVSNGFCFSISKRALMANAIPSSKIGKLSPLAFVPYDCFQHHPNLDISKKAS
jgi:hypothetical protein